jgi:HD superfamily phosphohydrolase
LAGTVGEPFWGTARKVRDDVWGDVAVDRAVRALLETAPVSRLKGMSPLGFTALAFPQARHTLFDHAIGVHHLVRLTLKRIVDGGAYLEDRDVRASLAAALLLDAGRPPYRAALEGARLPGLASRDAAARRAIEGGEVAEILVDLWDLEPHNVFRLVAYGDGAGDASGAPLRNLTPTEHLIRDVLAGSLNASTLDALRRDARGTQTPYAGSLDVEALLGSLRVVGQDNRAILAVEEGGAGHLQAFVFCRYMMLYNVYGHAGLRLPAAMLLRAVQDALEADALDPEELLTLDDAGLLARLKAPTEGKPDGTKPETKARGASSALVGRLLERRPYKSALELDERHPSYVSLSKLREDPSWRRRVEEAWARYLTRYRKADRAGPFDILIDLPERPPTEVGLRLIRHHPLPGERNPVSWQGVSGLSDEDTARLHAPLHRVRIAAATDDLVVSVRRHAEELFTIAEEVG